MKNVTCIYCPDPKEPSESHIIPDGLGKGPTLKAGVCRKCNNDINERIEQFAKSNLSLIRNFLNLSGRWRATAPLVEIHAEIGDLKGTLRVLNPADIGARCIVLTDKKDARARPQRIAFIASSDEEVAKETDKFLRKHPGAASRRMGEKDLDEHLKFRVFFDAGFFVDPRCFRLAAKIALEWQCLRRGCETVMKPDYTEIRSYILTGAVPSVPLVSIVSDPAILHRIHAPFGIHSILIANDPHSHDLVVYVGLFSWVYFKVVLTRWFNSLMRCEEQHLVNPQQEQDPYCPVIRRPVPCVINLAAQHPSDLVEPQVALRVMNAQWRRVLNAAFDEAARVSAESSGI